MNPATRSHAVLILLFAFLFVSTSTQAQTSNDDVPLVYFKFDENYQDDSGNSIEGIPNGGVSFVEDRFENAASAVRFNGIDGYIYSPLERLLSEATMAFWFKTEGEDLMTMGSMQAFDALFRADMGVEATGTVRVWWQSVPRLSPRDAIYTVDTYNDGQWHHAAVTRLAPGAQGLRIHIDGQLIDSPVIRLNEFANDLNVTHLVVGANVGVDEQGNLGTGNRYFDGDLDDVRVYDRVLSEQEILNLYECNQIATCPLENPWPEVDGPAIVVKLINSGSIEVAQIEAKLITLEGIPSTASAVFDEQDFAIFSVEEIFPVAENSYLLSQLRLLSADGSLVGHVDLNKTITSGERLTKPVYDFVLTIHNRDNELDFYNDQVPTIKRQGTWNYYEEGEYPVSMLVPPRIDYNSIDVSKSVLLLIHGGEGKFPYWGGALESFNTAESEELLSTHDVWQFYYPNDGPIGTSGELLAESIELLLSPGELPDFGGYDEPQLSVVAHSMGGLVTRSFIQGDLYDGQIKKFLMLGTPNHGSHSAYKIYFTKNILDEIFGNPDDHSPAYQQMTPGSPFLQELSTNTDPFGSLLPDGILVVAGTEDEIPIIHEEARNQDDGVVAVSSASLLNLRIPLATRDAKHRELTEADQVISSFLSDSYQANNLPDVFQDRSQITGFTHIVNGELQTPIPFDSEVDINKSLMQLSLASNDLLIYHGERDDVDNDVQYSMIEEGERLSICAEITNKINFIRPEFRVPQNTPPFVSYLFVRNDNQLKLPYDQGEKLLGISSPDFNGNCILRSELGSFFLAHGETYTGSFSLTDAQAAHLNLDNSVPVSATSGKQSNQNKNNYSIIVDASIDPLLVVLTAPGSNPEDLIFKLSDPDGNTIDQNVADLSEQAAFEVIEESGSAYLFIDDPEPGEWLIHTSDVIPSSAIEAAVGSELEVLLTLEQDSSITVGDEVNLVVEWSGADLCTDQPVITAASLKVGEVISNDISLDADGERYTGTFSADVVGKYRIDARLVCPQIGVERSTREFINVEPNLTDTSIEGTEGVSSEEPSALIILNYPNPFSNETTLLFTIDAPVPVKIKIYDVLGREVFVVLDEYRDAGTHAIRFEAGGLPNGTYFCKFETPEGTSVKKMMLIR